MRRDEGEEREEKPDEIDTAQMSPFFHIREGTYSAELKRGGIVIKKKKSQQTIPPL